MTVLHIVDAGSGMRGPDQTSHRCGKTLAHGWLRWAGAPNCLRVDPHGAQITGNSLIKPKDEGISVDPGLADAHWHMGQDENQARELRVTGNRAMEDMDIGEADFQLLLDEVTDPKTILCSTRDTCRHNGCSNQHRGFQATFVRKTLICHSCSLEAD